VRYVYGITAALLLGGTAATLTVGPVGAQTAQNEPGAIAAAAPRPGAPMSFADLAARLQPAVVNISTKQSIQVSRNQGLPPGFEEFFRRFGGRLPDGADAPVTQRGSSLGSGFIISADGYVVTNNHVITPARDNAVVESITVTLHDRTEYEAQVVGRDPASDLAVLKIRPRGTLPFVRFGDSQRVRVGDWVIAIGNPFTLGGTVTAGIVSALHRNIRSGQYDRYIQTDASINTGNSGGPMFDLNGNVIGINTALISPTGGNVGIGFAIPAEQARPVVEALRRGQRPARGYLGVTVQDLDESAANALGIEKNRGELVQSVTAGAGAARAGIQQGDVIITINNRPVTPDDSLSYIVSSLPAGTRVPIELIRKGQRRTVTAVVGERPTDEEVARLTGTPQETEVTEPAEAQQTPGQRSARESLGITFQALTPEIARSLRLTDTNTRAVVIAAVNPSSDAAAKGFQPGDIVLSINQQPTRTPEEAAAAVAAARAAGRASVLLMVRRGNTPPRFIGVDLTALR
jgi:serine protease Do